MHKLHGRRLPRLLQLGGRLALAGQLQVRQHAHGVAADALQHRGEQLKRLALVFLLRIFLRIAAQVDALAQVVHVGQVLFPQLVQHIQRHRLFHPPPLLLGEGRQHALKILLHPGENALAQRLLVQLRLVAQPVAQRQLDAELLAQYRLKRGNVPLLLQRLRRQRLVDGFVHHRLAHGFNVLRNVIHFHQRAALAVHHLALLVGDIVVFQQLLAHVKVAPLNFALRVFNGARHPRMLDGLALFHAEFFHQRGNFFRAEDAHQVVLHGKVEAARAGVALAPGAAAQLVVDAARFVALGAEHIKSAGRHHRVVARLPVVVQRGALLVVVAGFGQFLFQVAAEHNVGAAPGHVGGDGDGAGAAGLGDDLRLAFVVLGVQHRVPHVFLAEQARQILGNLNGHGAHQHRLRARLPLFDVGDDGAEFFRGGAVNQVGQIIAHHFHVRRHHRHLKAVNLLKLGGLGVGGAGHAGQLPVQAEVILKSDGSQRLVFLVHF